MPYPPLGTLYAIAYLREHGYEVKLFDTMFALSANEINPVIDDFKPNILISYDDGFNYLTKMCLTNMREACFEIQRYAKHKGCKVITSSSDAADHYEKYLSNGADVIAIGEAEQTTLELCEAFKNNTSIETISGIAYMDNGSTHFSSGAGVRLTSKRTVIKDLGSLPPPAWDLIDINPYKNMWLKHHGYFSLNFVTTRGCPYKCNWCAKPIYGNRYNSHSAQSIVLQIKKWQQQFGFTHVWFADDIFGLKPGWLKEFDFYVKQENLRINYKIQSRADLLLEENTIKHLANTGCTMVWMGAESGSQKVLDAMDKGTKVEQLYEATTLLKKHRIAVALFLQLGYLGETLEDIKSTIKMVDDLLPDDIGISVSYPLPGTKFYNTVKEQLKSKSNWKDSDDLDLMFTGTYSKEFYKQLQRYIHLRYKKNRSKDAIRKLKIKRSVLNFKNALVILKIIPLEKLAFNKLVRIEPSIAKELIG